LRWLDADEYVDAEADFGPEGVEALARLSRLEHLSLSRDGLTDAALAPLRRLERLRSLVLSRVKLKDLSCLPPTLESLVISGESVAALTSVDALPRLQRLEVRRAGKLSPAVQAVLDALKARGCDVVISVS
jgi:hypothetical protein